jgi:hypothetical protein
LEGVVELFKRRQIGKSSSSHRLFNSSLAVMQELS